MCSRPTEQNQPGTVSAQRRYVPASFMLPIHHGVDAPRPGSVASSSSGDDTMSTISSPGYIEQRHYGSAPRPYRTYRIYLKGTDKVIMVSEGQVVVQPVAEAPFGGGWNWECVESANWLGFRDHVSGKFLGHFGQFDSMGKTMSWVHAHDTIHGVDDLFSVREDLTGGYFMFMRTQTTVGLLQLGVAPDGKALMGKHDVGALWVFEEV